MPLMPGIRNLSVVLAAGVTILTAVAEDLEAGFREPPPAALPRTWWDWMNGNVTREGITADLESMAASGIGGATIFNLAGPHHHCDIPPGPADYLGPLWLDLLDHAAREAERLGLELGMQNCAGWSTTGGPWVTPELAMQQLVSSEITVEGGQRIERKLPQPEIVLDHYRDIAVFAVPVGLDSGYRIAKWQPKAGQRGGRAGRQPDLEPLPEGAVIPSDRIVEITDRLDEEGALRWDAPPGSWKIIRLGHTPTGMTNKPAPASATGLEIDKLRPEGLDVHWENGIQPVLDRLGPLAGRVFREILIDSYEAGLHHWTPRMRGEFGRRRGYDPGPFLLALTGRAIDSGPATERFYWDYRRTIADLFAENYYGHMAALCHRHGLRLAVEPYTSCFEGTQVGGRADVPMAEFWANKGYSSSIRLAASIAHTRGRPIAAAEAFTAGPEIGRWLNHPASLRKAGDFAWAGGINRLVLHSWPHQPWLDRAPGMTMGQYGCHFGRTTTWWKPGRAWLAYLARSQFLLQAGEPVADVLCYAGDAAPNGAVVRRDLEQAGHDYDSCGKETLMALSVEDGELVLPSGRRYRLLVLPGHAFHTPACARKLRELVRDGALVLGPRPEHTPSLENFARAEAEVRAIGREVWGDGKDPAPHRFGKGLVFTGVPAVEVLEELDLPPAVRLPDTLAWIRRRSGDIDIFFVSNQSGEVVETRAGFRAAGRVPEIWNAETVTTAPAAGWTVEGGRVDVPLRLDPGKSLFVIFRRQGGPPEDPVVSVEAPAGEVPTWAAADEPRLRLWSNGEYRLHHVAGGTATRQISGLTPPRRLEGPWTVRFQQERGAPESVRIESLTPWDEHPDPGVRYFSGTADYRIDFELGQDFEAPDRELWLDLGKVGVIAEVRLNGEDLGVLWHPPFRVEIGEAARRGSNRLEIAVTNLWVNRLIGDELLPDDCEWTGKALTRWPEWLVEGRPRPSDRVAFATWKHWTADDPLQPSGLVGPVVLREARLLAW